VLFRPLHSFFTEQRADATSRLFIDMVKAIASEKELAIIYVSHRDEDDLQPDKVFELVKTESGYTGKVIEA
jgi:molybdate transport system ATP-binding protein